MMRWAVSSVFVFQIYLAMLVLGLVFAPYALVSREGAYTACRTYCRWVMWTARWMVGIRTELRGPIPQGEALIVAKHQSFLDILILFEALPRAKFIMKREILWTPIIGLYARRLGCVPVDRGKGGAAVRSMVEAVAANTDDPGQLIIYAQGTRVAPGDYKPYKIGAWALYEGTGQDCVPSATNVGLFWPRRGIMRKPGLAVVEILETVEPGLEKDEFMARLEGEVEDASNRLMREGGFDPTT